MSLLGSSVQLGGERAVATIKTIKGSKTNQAKTLQQLTTRFKKIQRLVKVRTVSHTETNAFYILFIDKLIRTTAATAPFTHYTEDIFCICLGNQLY